MLTYWQSITLWKRVLIGLVIGLAIGLALRYGLAETTVMTKANGVETETVISGPDRAAKIANTWFRPFGDGFVRLIKMLIIPLITTTLIAGVTAMGDPKKLGSLGTRTIFLYLLTTLFAVSLGLTIGTFLKPGAGVDYATYSAEDLEDVKQKVQTAREAGGIVDRLLDIIPDNPVQALAETNVLPTIFFSILIGIAILVTGPAADPVKNFFESASEVVMRITMMIMELAPFGVLALMAWVMATKGIDVLNNLLWLAISLYLACFIQILVVYGFFIV